MWEKVKLGQLVNVSKGKKHNPSVNGINRYINIEDLHNPLNSVFTNENGTNVKQNDILIAWDGANAGKVGVNFEGVIGSTLARLQIKSSVIEASFLFWFLESKNDLIRSQRTGATIPHVNGNALKNIEVPLPPLPIQEKIAAILDKADKLRRKDQELQDKYDELAQAIFIDMFGDPARNEKGWEVKKIKDIASQSKYSIKAGPFGSALKKEYYVNEGFKIYGQEQVIADDLTIGDYYISEEKFNALKSCAVSAGDILISLVGTYGKISIVPDQFEPGIINPRLMKITLNESIYASHFFKFVMQTVEMKNYISTFSRGGTMDIVNSGIISNLNIIVPPLHLQEAFARKIGLINELKAKANTERSEELFQSLLQGAFKGELVSKSQLTE